MWRRWGKKNFFGIYWWTWKPNIYLKNCWSGPIKNKIFIFIQRYRAWQTEIGNFRSFFAPKNQKKKPFKKMKKFLDISSLYTCVPKIKIIWCMVSEIQSETDGMFCHFGLNWLNWFDLLFLVRGVLVILIDCMIFLSLSLDVTRMSMSTVSFPKQLVSRMFSFDL